MYKSLLIIILGGLFVVSGCNAKNDNNLNENANKEKIENVQKSIEQVSANVGSEIKETPPAPKRAGRPRN